MPNTASSQETELLSVILECKTAAEVLLSLQQSQIGSNLEIQASVVKLLYDNKPMRILLFSHLEKIEDKNFARRIFHNHISSFCLNDKNLLGLCIEANDPALFKSMVKEDIFNLHEVGTQFNGNIIQWLLKRGSQNTQFIEFYTQIGAFLMRYIATCPDFFHRDSMQFFPQSNLPHMLCANENFSPLSYLISQGGTEFAKELLGIDMEGIDWQKELAFRSKKVTCPLWVPYLPDLYPLSSEITLVNLVELGDIGNSAYKLINILVDSLLDTSDRANYSLKEWKKLERQAATVLENILNYQTLFAKLEKICDAPKLLKGKSALQKLIFFSTNSKIEIQLETISNDLYNEILDPSVLITMFGFISTLKEKNLSASTLCNGTSSNDLQAILDLLALVLSFWPNQPLDNCVASYGFTAYELESACYNASLHYKRSSKNRTQTQQEEKWHTMANESDMRSKLQALELIFCDLTQVKQTDLEKDLADIQRTINQFQGKLLKEFNKTFKTLNNKQIQHYRSIEAKKQRELEIDQSEKEALIEPIAPIVNAPNLNPVKTALVTPSPILPSTSMAVEEGFTTVSHKKNKSQKPKSSLTQCIKSHQSVASKTATTLAKKMQDSVTIKMVASKKNKNKTQPNISQPELSFSIESKQEFPLLSKVKSNQANLQDSPKIGEEDPKPETIEHPLESKSISQEIHKLVTTPVPRSNTIEETNQVILVYFFQYIEQMVQDLKIIETELTTQLNEFDSSSEITKTTERNAIRAVQKTAQIAHQLLQDLSSMTRAPCNLEESSDRMKLLVGPLLTEINKLERVRQSPSLSTKDSFNRTYLFHVWNAFLAAHLDTLDEVQLFLKSSECTLNAAQKPNFFALLVQLHHSFLPLRFKTDEEYLMHNIFQVLGNTIKKELENNKLGTYMQTVEGGTAIGGYLEPEPYEHSDYDIQSVVLLYDLKSYKKLEELVNRTIDEMGKTGLVPFVCTKNKSTVSEEKDFCLWTLAFSNGRTVDWRFVLRPLELTIHDRMFPLAQLYYDISDGVIFNPGNNFSFKTLLRLEDFIPEDVQHWKTDNLKMAFIAKTLAKTTLRQEIKLRKIKLIQESKETNCNEEEGSGEELVSMIRDVFKTIKTQSMELKSDEYEQILSFNVKVQTALTTLFGKRSLSIAGFHAMILKHDLVSLFNLDLRRDKKFLEQVNDIFIQQELQQPGWSKPAKEQISSVEYIAVLLSRVLYCKNEEFKWNNPGKLLDTVGIRKQITTLALHCLGRPYFLHAVEIAYAIEKILLFPRKEQSIRANYLCTVFKLGVVNASSELKIPSRNGFLHRKKHTPLSCTPEATTVTAKIIPVPVPYPVAVYQPMKAAVQAGYFFKESKAKRSTRLPTNLASKQNGLT